MNFISKARDFKAIHRLAGFDGICKIRETSETIRGTSGLGRKASRCSLRNCTHFRLGRVFVGYGYRAKAYLHRDLLLSEKGEVNRIKQLQPRKISRANGDSDFTRVLFSHSRHYQTTRFSLILSAARWYMNTFDEARGNLLFNENRTWPRAKRQLSQSGGFRVIVVARNF